MTAETYLAYLVTCAVFFATPPGPSQLLMIANSLQHGLKPSLATLAGDLSANAVQMSAAAFGLAALLASSATALEVVKWAGVAYLAWMGVILWRRPPADSPTTRGTYGDTNTGTYASMNGGRNGGRNGGAGAGCGRLYRQGFLTSAANPKAVFFFAALFPQFLDPGAPLLPQLLILGGTYLAIDGTLLLAYGALAARLRQRIRAGLARWLNKLSGGLMIAAAALLSLRDVERG